MTDQRFHRFVLPLSRHWATMVCYIGISTTFTRGHK